MKLIKLLLAVGAFTVAGLLVPKLLAEISSAETAYGYGRATGAMAVTALAAAVGMGFLRSAFAEDLLKDKKSGFGTLAILVLLGAGAGFILTGEKPAALLEKLPAIAGSALRGESMAGAKFASVEDAQREAVRRHPAVGVSGSAENKEYVARYKRYQQDRPDYFKTQDWPLRLAEEVIAKR